MTTFADVAQAVFTGSPDCSNVEEAEGIWTSQPTTGIQSFPYTTDVSRTKYPVNKRKNDVRSPTNPEVQTAPLNFEEIRKRLNDLRLEGRQGNCLNCKREPVGFRQKMTKTILIPK